MLFKTTLIVFGSIIAAAIAVDYCNSNAMNCGGAKHIACDNPLVNGGWGPTCRNPSLVQMTDKIKQAIVNIHNYYRNQIAIGNVSHYEPAANMGTLQWNDKLASFAEINVRNCTFQHDPCHNTETFHFSGQNIVKGSMSPPTAEFSEDPNDIANFASGWYTSEQGNGQYYGWMDMINKYPSTTDPNHIVGHFTAFIQNRATAVGCALSTYLEKMSGSDWKSRYLVCNYGFTNLVDSYVYISGKKTSKCTTGTNPDFGGLCSINEKFDYNL